MRRDSYELSRGCFTQAAKLVVDDYTKVNIDVLADGYCSALDIGDDFLQNGYMSAIILRFWSKIGKYTSLHPMLFPTYADTYDALVDAIIVACKPNYRVWQRSSTNAETAINQTFYTRHIVNGYKRLGMQKYGEYKKASEGGGGGVSEISLDTPVDDDNGETVGDKIACVVSCGEDVKIRSVVQSLLNYDKYVEAIIMDNALTKNVFRKDKISVEQDGQTYTHYVTSLWDFNLVQELNDLEPDYVADFYNKYEAPKKLVEAAFESIKKATSANKRKMISKCQNFLTNHPDEFIY